MKFSEEPNDGYRRNGNDLIYSHKISLLDALKSEPVVFQTLDGRSLNIAIDEVIAPQTVKPVTGEGMPIQSNDPLAALKLSHTRGDLYIKFDIQFP